MKDCVFLIVLIVVAIIGTCVGWGIGGVLWPKDKEPVTEQSISWIGSPVVGVIHGSGEYAYRSRPTITSCEIGLRYDGVVVWRLK